GAVKLLKIPCGIIINRSDLGDEKVRDFAREEDITILMEIPFERRIAESYSRGELVIESIPEWKGKFLELYNKILSILK
ncbi:(4Fe-4S)-binding protein, partial [Thermodesulfobacteriota bacterium]